MAVPFTVVVSSENNHYMAWQTQLFCYSCITRLHQAPIVIVHDTGSRLRPEFGLIGKFGCKVVMAPSFVNAADGKRYVARNEIASLVWLTKLGELKTDHILFCEPDMIFLGLPEFEPGTAAEKYDYMDYRERRVAVVARKLGLESSIDDLNNRYPIGVPYLLPCLLVQKLAVRWMALIDSFEALDWIDIMYAFGFAAFIEEIPFRVSSMMVSNKDDSTLVGDRLIIHYPYGSDRWNKRNYTRAPAPIGLPEARLPSAPKGSVLGEIVSQIAEAREFFGYGNPLRRGFDRFWFGRMSLGAAHAHAFERS